MPFSFKCTKLSSSARPSSLGVIDDHFRTNQGPVEIKYIKQTAVVDVFSHTDALASLAGVTLHQTPHISSVIPYDLSSSLFQDSPHRVSLSPPKGLCVWCYVSWCFGPQGGASPRPWVAELTSQSQLEYLTLPVRGQTGTWYCCQ